jgi:hypothetical protein
MVLICACGQNFPSNKSLRAHHRGCLVHQHQKSGATERIRKQYHEAAEAREQRRALAETQIKERQLAARAAEAAALEIENNVSMVRTLLSLYSSVF